MRSTDNIIKGRCAVCGEEETQYFPLDTDQWSPMIVDGMEDDQLLNLGFGHCAQQINNAMLSRVSVCRHCGYCAADIFKPTEVRKKDVESPIYRNRLYRDRLNLNSMHLSALILATVSENRSAMAYHMLILEWNKISMPFREELPNYSMDYIADNLSELNGNVILALIDVFRIRKDFESAKKAIAVVRERGLGMKESMIADFQEYLVEEHDFIPHTVSESYEYVSEKEANDD